jgi:hypothetical protein
MDETLPSTEIDDRVTKDLLSEFMVAWADGL